MEVLCLIAGIVLFMAVIVVCLAIACGKLEQELKEYKFNTEREDKRMKEITRVINAQITIIESMSEEDADLVLAGKADAEASVKATLEKQYSANDVQVEIKDFVIDKDGAE